MKNKNRVFYSWQSDLPRGCSSSAIRSALRSASNIIEEEDEDSQIVLDEATRDTLGSPNIPLTIFKKILSADIFIGDLTTINSESNEGFRKTPNPNVLVELGYAIALLGWERIIMVFNLNFGTFPDDLPFDIDRHRVISFRVNDKKDTSGKKQLSNILVKAIKGILDGNPLRPYDKSRDTEENRKRRIDINNLEWCLGYLNIKTFDYFLREIPTVIIGDIFFYKDSFCSIVESNSFHIYDEELMNLVLLFKSNWDESLSYHQHYHEYGIRKQNYKFYLPMDVFPNKSAEQDFKHITEVAIELESDFKRLLDYIRNNYLEIDLDKTSQLALKRFREDEEK